MSKVEWLVVLSIILGLVLTSGDVVSASNEEAVSMEVGPEGVVTFKVGDRDSGRAVWTSGEYCDLGAGVVKFGEDIEVAETDTVHGDVVLIFGDIVCKGVIKGNAVSVVGDVIVEDGGLIEGDATSVGGKVITAGNGKVGGEVVTVAPKYSRFILKPMKATKKISDESEFARSWLKALIAINKKAGRLLLKMLILAITILIGWVIIAIGKKGVENVSLTARRDPFKAGLVGLAVWVIAVVIGILFAITLVGIPLAILMSLLLFIGMLFGKTALCVAIGERWARKNRSVYEYLAVGAILVYSIYVLGGVIGLGEGIFAITGYILSAIGVLIIFVVCLIGLGGVVLSRFGTRASNSKNGNSLQAKM